MCVLTYRFQSREIFSKSRNFYEIIHPGENEAPKSYFSLTQSACNSVHHDCQIFLSSWFQNWKNVPNEHKMDQMIIKYPNYSKWPCNISTFFNLSPPNLPNFGFWFENKPSGNPGVHAYVHVLFCKKKAAQNNSIFYESDRFCTRTKHFIMPEQFAFNDFFG
jgi:hypothetical protein